jgi:hypothetical protein
VSEGIGGLSESPELQELISNPWMNFVGDSGRQARAFDQILDILVVHGESGQSRELRDYWVFKEGRVEPPDRWQDSVR